VREAIERTQTTTDHAPLQAEIHLDELWYKRPDLRAGVQRRRSSSEKTDMNARKGRQGSAPNGQAASTVELATVLSDMSARRIMRKGPENPPLRCVSSGYLSGGCSCRATIPAGVVTDAWAHQQRAGVAGDKFFHFTWRADVWLAFGLRDGRIRGVYCPEHRAERDQRSLDDHAGEEDAQAAIALTG
jgi:hypothetical protein